MARLTDSRGETLKEYTDEDLALIARRAGWSEEKITQVILSPKIPQKRRGRKFAANNEEGGRTDATDGAVQEEENVSTPALGSLSSLESEEDQSGNALPLCDGLDVKRLGHLCGRVVRGLVEPHDERFADHLDAIREIAENGPTDVIRRGAREVLCVYQQQDEKTPQ